MILDWKMFSLKMFSFKMFSKCLVVLSNCFFFYCVVIKFDVQVPSVLMEYFARDPRVLSVFAKHHKTREVLPPDMIKSLCDAENMSSPSEMQTQVSHFRKLQGERHQ